ncbi:MAG: hypothetical protein ISN29_01300 [Gammaproteobacteria bacterium AqS3]|nr:hypothetical protein [Gammaproteobacteria bacterium AqS3]
MVMVVYVLYLVGLAIGITSIIGVILAHLRMRDSTGWMHSHYRWQIRTFWFALLWSVIGLALAAVLVGVPILIGVCIWIIYRCVRGLMLWSDQKPTPIGDA